MRLIFSFSLFFSLFPRSLATGPLCPTLSRPHLRATHVDVNGRQPPAVPGLPRLPHDAARQDIAHSARGIRVLVDRELPRLIADTKVKARRRPHGRRAQRAEGKGEREARAAAGHARRGARERRGGKLGRGAGRKGAKKVLLLHVCIQSDWNLIRFYKIPVAA